jgi:hypothetical protein
MRNGWPKHGAQRRHGAAGRGVSGRSIARWIANSAAADWRRAPSGWLHAAERIAREGHPAIHTVWLDGFYALPDPELAVIGAMCRHADVTLTLPVTAITEPTRERLLAMGFVEEACTWERAPPRIDLCATPSIEREADEIARRILEQAAAGRPFREMGVIVRSPEIYEPVLRATLDRFGIPARFYFDADLSNHPLARYLTGIVDAHARRMGSCGNAGGHPAGAGNRVRRIRFRGAGEDAGPRVGRAAGAWPRARSPRSWACSNRSRNWKLGGRFPLPRMSGLRGCRVCVFSRRGSRNPAARNRGDRARPGRGAGTFRWRDG